MNAQPPRFARLLPTCLLATIICHGLAMAGMALLLLPGMPGGTAHSVAERVHYVAQHPWAWRIGWAGWQATAASDVLLAAALVATRWIPKGPAILTLIVTFVAIVPDQFGQYQWAYHGPALAAASLRQDSVARYLVFESRCFHDVAALGTVGYLAGALGWTWCFAAAGTWSTRLTQLSIATWGLFAVATALTYLPAAWLDRLNPVVSAGNAIAFVLLMIWLVAVYLRVNRRATI